MGQLEDLITQSEKEVSEANQAGEAEREQADQARLDSLRKAKQETDSAKGNGRTEGRDSGIQKERERIAKARGVSVEELDAKLEADAKAAAESQSEAERLQKDLEAANKKAEEAEAKAEKHEAEARQRSIDDAITAAASELGYKGKAHHLPFERLRSQVTENDGTFDAKAAVQAEKDDGFPGFEKEKPESPDNPPPNNGDRKTGETAADKFEKRVGRRGRVQTS